MNTSLDTASSVLVEEKNWQDLISETPAEVRKAVNHCVRASSAECAGMFYASMLSHPDARVFLSSSVVDTRLRAALKHWLEVLFDEGPLDAHALAETQRHIGHVHARARVPIHVVLQGAQLIKHALRDRLHSLELPDNVRFSAIVYVDDMIDIAVMFISQTFVSDIREDAGKDEAFRLMSLGQDITLERETQRAALLDWSHKLLLAVCYGTVASFADLGQSGFGLWIRHKGGVLFDSSAEFARIDALMTRIDGQLLPTLRMSPSPSTIQDIQSATEELQFLLDQMFKAIETIESGRDPLTQTLNRRFLPNILGREIALSLKRDKPFSLLMVDVDHFSTINSQLGHIGGDTVLRTVADTLGAACRPSDFIFRYGGEEFLVVLIESSQEEATHIAERIRSAIENLTIMINGVRHNVTVSIGIGTLDGHPDYSHLIERTDRALYRAKAAGRNCWKTA